MSRGNDDGANVLGIIFLVAVGILILYFLSKLAFIIGIIGIIVSIFLIVIGFKSGGDVMVYGIIIFIISLLLVTIGHTGVHFFEKNPTGQVLLNGSKQVFDAGTGAYVAVTDSQKAESELYKKAIGSLTPP